MAQPLSRREFLLKLVRRAEPPRARRAGTAKIRATTRSQLMDAAAVLGARYGRRLPAELFPALRVSDACCNHQVCAAACPTGALRAYATDDGRAAGIAFEAATCIACADCTRACPERALTLVPQGDGKAPRGATALTRWTPRECHDCGDAFTERGLGGICPSCRKTRELARADISRLFGIAGKEPA